MNISRNENTTYVTINYQQNKPIFEGKTVLITGGSTGIGFATAKMCIDNGAEVIITGRNLEKLKSAQNELGDRCCISQFDISDLKSIETEVDKMGIRCNAVAPGYTATCIFEQGGEYPDLNPDGNLYKGDIRGKRFHRPEEIAQVIIFLLSDASSCINGYVIPCDSGATVL